MCWRDPSPGKEAPSVHPPPQGALALHQGWHHRWQPLPSVTSLCRALFNPVTAEATEPFWLEIFYHLLSGALALAISTAVKKGKVFLQSGQGMCEGGGATRPCFSGWKERTYCLPSLLKLSCLVGQLSQPDFSCFVHCWLFRTSDMVLSGTLPSTHRNLLCKTASSAINMQTRVRSCRKSCSSHLSSSRRKTLSRIYWTLTRLNWNLVSFFSATRISCVLSRLEIG